MIPTARSLACSVMLLGALAPARSLHAQIGVGTWVRKGTDSMPGITMIVEACCGGGRRLTYHINMNGAETIMSVDSRFDGSEAPVLIAGKPSGETMAIKRLDDHHTIAIMKQKGQAFGTSKSTLSADGRTLTVLNDYSGSAGSPQAGKYTEIWVRK